MSNITKYIIGSLVTVIVLFLVWYFSNIVAYILISAVLAIIGKPMVDTILKLKIRGFVFPRWLAALLTLMTIWAVMILFFTFFIPLIFNKISELSRLDIPQILETFKEPLQQVQQFIVNFFSIKNDNFSLMEEISRQLSGMFDLGAINKLFSSAFSLIGNIAVALFSISFITFFFLKEDSLFLNMLIIIFPKKYEQNIIHAMDSITNLLMRYFTGILAESTIITILLSCAFMIWGFNVETALFMGLVMGVLNVIPYIGPIIGASFCMVVGIVTPMEGYTISKMILTVGGTILCVKGLDDFVLQPMLYSNRVNAHPLEIFLVILIAGSVAGVLGMLLAIPSYNVIRVFAKEFFNNFRLVQKLTENI